MNDGAIELDKRPGKIEVSPSAIATAVSRVVLECYGVVGIAHRRLRHGKAELLEDRAYSRGVIVAIEGGEVVIDVYIVVEYGTRISEVANNVISGIRDSLQRMLGPAAIRVKVNIQGLRISS